MNPRVPTAVLCGLASLAVPVRAGNVPEPQELPATLRLADAINLFRTRGLDLLLADAAVESAHGDLRSAKAIVNPQVNLSLGSTKNYDPSLCSDPNQCSATAYSIGVADQGALFDFLTGKHGLRVDVASHGLESATLSRTDAERTGAFAVKQQYLVAALAKESLAFAVESRESSAETLRLVGLRYDAGAVSEADVARAEAAKLEADQAVDQATQGLRQAKVNLAFLLGVRHAVPDFDLGAEFQRATVPEVLASATRDELLALGFRERPDLKAIQAQKARAEAAVNLAKRQRIPDLGLSLEYSQQGSGQEAIQPPTTTVGMNLTLPLFNQNQGEITKAQADLRTQDLQGAKLEAQIVNDVEGGFAAYVSARSQVERMDSRLLERTQRARDLVRIQYEKGAASLLELLDAQRTLIAAHVERLQDLTNYWTAVFQLEQAVGKDLRP
jgi:cobalt-zinc-cadmium efflux system outer membrane protein